MTEELRTTLHRIADEATPVPFADDLWQRGRAARRRGQAFAVAAVLALVVSVGGAATLLAGPDPETRTASTEEVLEGAIPSRIEDPGSLTPAWDLAIGRASVAFFSVAGQPVVIGATDGRYHALDLPDLSTDRGPLRLSPEGRQLAWRNGGRIHVLDLVEGSSTYYPRTDEHADVTALEWSPSSDQLLWTGRDGRGQKSGGVLPVGGPGGELLFPSALRGIPSPTGDLVAVASRTTGDAAPFVQRRGKAVGRSLPQDLYPSGASITPLGWVTDDLALAQVFAAEGSDVEGQHLALFTAPSRPEVEWTYRIITRDVPQNAVPLSIAVDLIPNLDGTSAQQLTHDFSGEAGSGQGRGTLPYVLGGLLALLVGLAYIRMLHKQA